MQLSGFKSELKQQTMFDTPLGNHGHIRTVLGEFVEELTASLLGARRHRTDARCSYCPDVSKNEIFYFECKSVGRTKGTFIYQGRLEKDATFYENHSLHYVIWHHTCQTKQASTIEDLKALFLMNLKAVYIVPFSEILTICQQIPVTNLNSAYGKSNGDKGYGRGYRIPLKLLQPWKLVTCKVANRF